MGADVKENQLRRIAERRGYRLEKSCQRDPLDVLYRLVSAETGHVVYAGASAKGEYGATLDEVETFLDRRPIDLGSAEDMVLKALAIMYFTHHKN